MAKARTIKKPRGKTAAGYLNSKRYDLEPLVVSEAESRLGEDLVRVNHELDARIEKEIAAQGIEREIAAQGARAAKPTYRLSIYIHGFPGSYEYRVDTLDQAMNHFAAITTTGYRRVNDRGQLQWYAPSQIASIKIDGPGLDTHYPDTFRRT